MHIRPVKSAEELAAAYRFLDETFNLSARRVRGLDFYGEKYKEHPGLLLVAEDEGRLLGALLASVEGDHVLIGEMAVVPDARGRGIGAGLLAALERSAQAIGYRALLAGAVEGAEGFYIRSGFSPRLFVQVMGGDSAPRLERFLATVPVDYPIIWRDDAGGVSKAIIETKGLDREFQRRVEREVPDCHTQYLVSKAI